MLEDFDKLWSNIKTRIEIIPGKELLSSLNEYLQEKYSVSLTHTLIVNTMKKEEIPSDIIKLLGELEKFRREKA